MLLAELSELLNSYLLLLLSHPVGVSALFLLLMLSVISHPAYILREG